MDVKMDFNENKSRKIHHADGDLLVFSVLGK
jgi:hypothetical protein